MNDFYWWAITLFMFYWGIPLTTEWISGILRRLKSESDIEILNNIRRTQENRRNR